MYFSTWSTSGNTVRAGQTLSGVADPRKAGPREYKKHVPSKRCTPRWLCCRAPPPSHAVCAVGGAFATCASATVTRGPPRGPGRPPPPLTVVCGAGDEAHPPRRWLSAPPRPHGTLWGATARSATHKGLSARRGARRPLASGRSSTIVFLCGIHVGPLIPPATSSSPGPTRPPPDVPAPVRVCAFTVASSPP